MMGHAERIIAEIAALDDAEKAAVLEYVEHMKSTQTAGKVANRPTTERARDRDALAAELQPFRASLKGYEFNREEANAR
jgi:hypothetical protein